MMMVWWWWWWWWEIEAELLTGVFLNGELMCNVWKKRYRVKKLINEFCTVCLVMPLNHFNPNQDILKIDRTLLRKWKKLEMPCDFFIEMRTLVAICTAGDKCKSPTLTFYLMSKSGMEFIYSEDRTLWGQRDTHVHWVKQLSIESYSVSQMSAKSFKKVIQSLISIRTGLEDANRIQKDCHTGGFWWSSNHTHTHFTRFCSASIVRYSFHFEWFLLGRGQ